MEEEAGPVLVFIEVKAEACRMWTHSGQANLTLCNLSRQEVEELTGETKRSGEIHCKEMTSYVCGRSVPMRTNWHYVHNCKGIKGKLEDLQKYAHDHAFS